MTGLLPGRRVFKKMHDVQPKLQNPDEARAIFPAKRVRVKLPESGICRNYHSSK